MRTAAKPTANTSATATRRAPLRLLRAPISQVSTAATLATRRQDRPGDARGSVAGGGGDHQLAGREPDQRDERQQRRRRRTGRLRISVGVHDGGSKYTKVKMGIQARSTKCQ